MNEHFKFLSPQSPCLVGVCLSDCCGCFEGVCLNCWSEISVTKKIYYSSSPCATLYVCFIPLRCSNKEGKEPNTNGFLCFNDSVFFPPQFSMVT